METEGSTAFSVVGIISAALISYRAVVYVIASILLIALISRIGDLIGHYRSAGMLRYALGRLDRAPRLVSYTCPDCQCTGFAAVSGYVVRCDLCSKRVPYVSGAALRVRS